MRLKSKMYRIKNSILTFENKIYQLIDILISPSVNTMHRNLFTHIYLSLFQLTEALKKRPMQSMNPTQKAGILAFLCNELLTSKVVSSEIEGHIETVQNLRRDKWVAESKMRK